jgi:DNA-binding winged helix-turn-helix (wHTH) protein
VKRDLSTVPDVADGIPKPSEHVLTAQEKAVLLALVESRDRVIGRRELARRAGLTEVSERRCDSLLVSVRRALGPESVRTVRGRGWMIASTHLDIAKSLLARSDETVV